MLQQDRPANAAFGGHSPAGPPSSLRILNNSQQQSNRKDGNFNFLGQDDDSPMGDENRNQVRTRPLGPLGRDQSPLSNYYGAGPLSPLSRLPCWSPLEPLPEIESGEDSSGRVPPDGAEEGKINEEMRQEGDVEEFLKGEPLEVGEDEEILYWDDSDDEFGFSYKSSGSSTPLSGQSLIDVTREVDQSSVWDRICVGGSTTEDGICAADLQRDQSQEGAKKGDTDRKSLMEDMGMAVGGFISNSDTDTDAELPGLMEAVWSLQDRERFKAQEMEKHQAQLIMYRRLALIRWVRTLQGRVQEQQNRLQSSFDVILTHRKELLRMGSAAACQ